MQKVNLTQHFLIAMPNMADPHFAKSLTYVCEHNDQGALGVVINRPIDMNLGTLLEQVSINAESGHFKSVAVHFGGPVQVDRGFVSHTPLGEWQSTLAVNPEIGLTTSKDILEAVARGDGPGPQPKGVPGLYHIAFDVGTSPADLAAARRHVEAHGLAPFGEYERGFCVRDPDGHEIELYVEPGRPDALSATR